VRRDPGATSLRIEIVGEHTLLTAQIRRLFPASEPDRFFSIQDGFGKEVAILDSLEGADAETCERVEQEFDRRYFTPRIVAIDSLCQDGGMWLFEAVTQRGPVRFYVRNWRDSSHELKPGRWTILSVDGQRFEIPRWDELDERSRRLLEQLF
jgi:hypothetical protein